KQNVFLNNILESLTHPFYVINVKDYTVALANFTASSEGLELGQYCYSLTHNRNKPCEASCVCPLEEVKNTKRACVVEHIHYDKEGNEKAYEIYGYPILDESGNVVQMIEYALNISDRKKAEQELKESEEKFRTIAEQSFMGILIIQDNQNKYSNNAFVNMFEYSQKEILNWEDDDITKIIHPEDLLILREYREHLRSGDKSLKQYYSYRVVTKSGKIKWIDQFSKEILYRGRLAELVTVIDITEKKEAEQELIKLNNLKSELLRRTSHELKTPLVSIKGFSDILLELHRDKLDDYVVRTINQIRMGCNRLESLVNDILKTAELESGTVELKKSKEDLSLLINISVNELEGLSELRNHTINLEISDNLICSFEKKQIFNVITNILSNAIKYTPYNGKIEVKSEINNDFIIVSIKDNGIGFTEQEKTQIFKQFGKIER
ncbi:MAG: PAS domain S-box protein, partial [Candidatus Lokiarchaeota archaeon]|nr:PAS domain S-box protein [Candidatus Lokiarchaeota archaeon]